ncbi:hypothetical protein [Effusibacillus lacus]|uniref:DNA-binding response regulator n=1 Tax=Effusibacillus lacus TaxID=1348429 RepID=A0A292YTK0_9BACL|nr:hypothetical protein [Effusibacillus lacus]TCS73701.1 hypothetical protein EDD64_1161 [Effusibacillus lacus]GAX92083.1 hypothetical protein EFBL_3774 [Effusibacillus lacus]
MDFQAAYKEFIATHLKRRKGERLRRLKEGHGHAEKLFLEQVWWPAFGQFNYLHPEYEVHDFRDGYRYIDFAYIRPHFQVAFEIDGFGPHLRNLSRWQYSDHLLRQNHLIIDGWKVIRFTYDDVNEKPRVCQQMIQQLMGRWLGEERNLEEATYMEKEVMRMALRLCRPITPGDVCRQLGVENRFARKLLHSLVAKKWLVPASGQTRIRTYRPNLEGKNFLL